MKSCRFYFHIPAIIFFSWGGVVDAAECMVIIYDIVNETLYLYCEINDPLVYTNLAPETRF